MRNVTANPKHTPGPWNLSSKGDGRTYVEGGERADDIAALLMDHDQRENGANARLIAAAPDLLDALRILEEFVTELTKAGEDRQNRLVELEGDKGNRLFAARAAIAKATGGVA